MKESFILRKSDARKFKRLTDEQLGKLIRVLYAYEFEEEEPDEDIDPVIGVAFDALAERLDADREAYNKKCEENRKKAESRWNKEKGSMPEHAAALQEDTEVCQSMPEHTEACHSIPSDTALCLSDTDTDIKEKDTLTGIQKEKRVLFKPPTVDEVREYAVEYSREHGKEPINAERFCDFYASKNWMVGKNKMKDWKAAVRNWMNDDSSKSSRAARAAPAANFRQRDSSYTKMMEDGNW